MGIFSHLSKIRDFEKAHLPFLLTLEDFEIVRTIGLHQERLQPLLLKQLYLEGIGSIATVRRRLGRLRTGGYVMTAPNGLDRRAITLLLSPGLHKIYVRYGTMLNALAA